MCDQDIGRKMRNFTFKITGWFLLFDNPLKGKKNLKAIPHHLFNYRLINIPNILKKPKGLS